MLYRLLALPLTAEYRIRTQDRGRTVDEWKIRPEWSDNHGLDCLVGCSVGASLLGVHLPETGSALPPKRKTFRMSELQRASGRARDHNTSLGFY